MVVSGNLWAMEQEDSGLHTIACIDNRKITFVCSPLNKVITFNILYKESKELCSYESRIPEAFGSVFKDLFTWGLVGFVSQKECIGVASYAGEKNEKHIMLVGYSVLNPHAFIFEKLHITESAETRIKNVDIVAGKKSDSLILTLLLQEKDTFKNFECEFAKDFSRFGGIYCKGTFVKKEDDQ